MKNVVKQFPVYKSLDVEGSHEHKLWWLDIEKLPGGKYQIVTYAQLFVFKDNVVQGLEVRRYECGAPISHLGNAESSAHNRIARKTSIAKGYSHFMDRLGDGFEFDINIAKAFLNKYAGLH